jgi:hypothetical protein
LRAAEPGLELIACGSSSSSMPTFGTWESTVLEHTYDVVDYLSCHAYYEELDGDLGSFLANAVDMDHFVNSIVATADSVGARLRSRKKINRSFDGVVKVDHSVLGIPSSEVDVVQFEGQVPALERGVPAVAAPQVLGEGPGDQGLVVEPPPRLRGDRSQPGKDVVGAVGEPRDADSAVAGVGRGHPGPVRPAAPGRRPTTGRRVL